MALSTRSFFMFRFVFLFSLLLASTLCAPATWSSCGSSSDVGVANKVELTPAAPARQTAESIFFEGTLKDGEVVSGGSVSLIIQYLGLTLYSQHADVCTLVQCPLKGDFSATLTIPSSAIPSYSPPGAYVGQAKITDQANNQIACVNVNFSL